MLDMQAVGPSNRHERQAYKSVRMHARCISLLALVQELVGVQLAPTRLYCVAAALLPLLRAAWSIAPRTNTFMDR